MSVSFFANVFEEPGVFVFYDNYEMLRQTIVVVPQRGARCQGNMDASDPTNLVTFNVGMQKVDEAPNKTVMYIIVGLMLVFVVVLVILAVLWRPRSMGIYPISVLRPKYKTLGAPIPSIPIPGLADNPEALGPRGDPEGASSFEYYSSYGTTDFGLLENFNTRTLYDKIEDQTLHISSQLAHHQNDLRGFYDRISKQTDGLKNLLDNLDVSKLARATEKAAAATKDDDGKKDGRKTSVNVKEEPVLPKDNIQYALTGGAAAREAELQKTLYELLQRYKDMPAGGFFPGGVIYDQATPGIRMTGDTIVYPQVPSDAPVAIYGETHQKLQPQRRMMGMAMDRQQPIGADLPDGLDYTYDRMAQGMIQLYPQTMAGGAVTNPLLPNKGGVQYEAGDFGKVLQVMNAERMQLETGLQDEENGRMQLFAEQKEAERKHRMKEMSFQLADLLTGDLSPEEMKAIIGQHNKKLEEMEDQFDAGKRREESQLLKELSDRRQGKVDALIWRHGQLALEKNMKLANVSEGSNLPAELASQQHSLDLVVLEQSKSAAISGIQIVESENRDYNNEISENFSKQIGMLVENGALYADRAQELMNEEIKLSEKYEKEMGETKERQMALFRLKLAERKAAKLRRLAEQQEIEKAQAIQDGVNLDELSTKHEKERELVELLFETQEAEQNSEITKKLNEENQDTLKQAHRNLLNELVQNKALDSAMAAELMDQLRKETNAIADNLENRRQKNMSDLETKLAARKARRQEELKRQGQEKAAQRIVEEQSHLAIESQPTSAVIDIPNIIPGQSAEEQALKNEQQRAIEDLKEKQTEDLEKLEDRLKQEAKKDEEKATKEFEAERQRAFREIKNRQAAELTARSNLSSDETQKLLAAHQQQMDNLNGTYKADKEKQLNSLQQKVAEKRKARADAMKKKQENEMAKEVIEQKKEMADTERNVLKNQEREAMLEAIRENGAEATEYIIKKVLEQRQAREVTNLENLFAEERKLEIDNVLVKLDEKHQNEKDELRDKQEKEYKSIAAEDLSPDEVQQRRSQLLNKQQIEMSHLEKSQASERAHMQKNAVSEWELQYAKAKLELKEKHYKEYAEYLSDLSADEASEHQSSIKQAQEAARQLQEVREKLEQKKKEDEERLKREAEAFEIAEKERMEADLRLHEEQIERESEGERKKHEKSILALNARKEALLKEKKLKAKQEVQNMIKLGSSKDEQEAVLKQHSKDLAKVMNKMDADRMRLQSQLEERLKKKREARKKTVIKELEVKADEARQEFEEKLESEGHKIKNDATLLLKETINIDTLVKASIPEIAPQTEEPSAEMPTGFVMTAPMSDNELANILMQSPLYEKLQTIKDVMTGVKPAEEQKPKKEPLADDHGDSSDNELLPVDMDTVNAREFVIYKFSCFLRDLLSVHCLHKPVDILLAEKLPANNDFEQNAYRNSFHYDAHNRILYLRRDRLENVGEFNLVLIHTLTHIHVGDMRDDSDPKFMKDFYKALSVVCSDLFLSRYRRANALNDAVMCFPEETATQENIGKQIFENIFQDAHDEIDRNNVVSDLLDTKLIRNKNYERKDFDQQFAFQRLHKYTDFIVGNKLRNFLGEVEDKLGNVRKLGSQTEVERRLNELQMPVNDQRPISRYVPSRNKAIISDTTRQNNRNMALARSPLALSFTPSRQTRPRSAQAPSLKEPDTQDDFYETFLKAQIDELQNKIDELDYEFTTLTRHSLELTTQVRNLEVEVADQIESVRNANIDSIQYEKLSEMARSSIKKVNAAKSQLTHAMISKSERLKRLEAYKRELQERENILEQHKRKPAEERAQRAERKLESAIGRSEKE